MVFFHSGSFLLQYNVHVFSPFLVYKMRTSHKLGTHTLLEDFVSFLMHFSTNVLSFYCLVLHIYHSILGYAGRLDVWPF